MKVIADLHIHGRYAAACSKDISIANLEKYARIKGVSLLGTGDCFHPQWLEEIRKNLEDGENGIFWTRDKYPFILQSEISLVYTQGNKGRRIHYIILVPNLEVLGQITEELRKRGRLDYDGRPIFGFSSVEFVEKMMGISKDIEIIPAHAWTSWYGIFGSMSGFDSLEECFGEKTKYIHAIETGLSSNPKMNWRIKFLDNIAIVSFSDLHSCWPWRLGREATVFDVGELSYTNIIDDIRENRIEETIEFFPEEGKYHFDGHRNCNFSCSPSKSKELKGICPRCGGKLTIGVLNRVEQLADREEGYVPNNSIPYKSLVPLSELIAAVLGTTPYSKGTWEVYSRLIERFGNEFNVLLNVSKEELEKVIDKRIAEFIIKNRAGQIEIKPGYDGVYGKIILGADKETGDKNNLKRFI